MSIVASIWILELREMDEQSNLMYNNNLLALSSAKEANIQLISMSLAIRNMALADSQARATYCKAYDGFLEKLHQQLDIAGSKLLAANGKVAMQKTRDLLGLFCLKIRT